MDPIQPKITPNIQPPQTPAADAPAAPAQKFTLGSTGAAATPPNQGAARPNFDSLAGQIQSAVGRSLSRDQVRDEVIGQQAKEAFGAAATPEMTAAIGEAFKNDPHLSQLFNQLYAKATAK